MEIDPAVLKKITTDPRPKCQSCEDVSVTSVAYCFVCSILYCQNCWEKHQGISPTNVHKSISLDDALKNINENEKKPQSTHANEKWADTVEVTAKEAMKQNTAVAAACNGFMMEGDKLEQVLSRGQMVKKSIQQRRKEVDSDITTAFVKLRQMLDQRERVLLSESCHTAANKDTCLSVQLESIKHLQIAMSECHNISKNAKTQEDWTQVRAMAEQLLVKFSDTSLELCENALMLVEVETDQVSEDIESLGYVTTASFSNKSIVSDPLPFAIVGKEVSFSVHTRSASGEGIGHGGEVVRGVLAKKGEAESRVIATTCDHGDGTYHLSVKLKVIGEHSLSVSVHGQHVESSPFVLHVTRDYAALKDPVKKLRDEVRCPCCIAFADNADMFIVSQSEGSVCVFENNGCYKSRIGKQGSSDQEFSSPYGIAISGNTVYVSDIGSGCIKMFTTSGKFLGKLGSFRSSSNQLLISSGVCTDDNGMVYAGDMLTSCVKIFHADGTFSHSIEPREGALKNPWCLALGHNGDLHVTGNASNNVTVFSPEGTFIRSYGVKEPQGIAIDRAGFSLVSSQNGVLSIFNPFGQLIKEIKGIGDARAVAIAPDGFVWVSISNGNHLLKY